MLELKLTQARKRALLHLLQRESWSNSTPVRQGCLKGLEKHRLIDRRGGYERLTPEGRKIAQALADRLKAQVFELMDWDGFVAFAYELGEGRQRSLGRENFNEVDFFMGAASLYAYLDRADMIPAAWVFLPIANKSILE